ncbi:MAG: Trk system potassium transporter TrkA [Lachnospiraceae bacterium]|nr:Trk system potassium transporter TrkA [Lachnospiraceae bacterium]
MKIIVAGCGKVGYTLAEQLTAEGHDLTIIDISEEKIQNVTANLDVMGITGNGTSFRVQREAGVEEADLLIAVTNQDELNLLCCLIAKKAGNCKTVARVRNPEYYAEIGFIKEELGLSLAINPELAAAADIRHLIQVPSAMEINTFAKGRVNLVKLVIPEGSEWDNKKVLDIGSLCKISLLICIVERSHEVMIPDGNTVLKAGDSISVIAPPEKLNELFANIGIRTHKIRNVMIAGGSKIAYYLADRLTRLKMQVKIVETNRKRCEDLCDLLPKARIIHGDASNHDILLEEGLPQMDAFVSLTDYDEENIMLSLYAHKVSNAKLITKINKIAYDDVIDDIPVGSIVSPKSLTTEYIVQYVRSMQNSMGSNVEAVYLMEDNQVEALEFVIKERSRVTDIPLMDLKLKKNLLVCNIVRKGNIIVPSGQDSLKTGDIVIIVTTNKGLNDITDILA